MDRTPSKAPRRAAWLCASPRARHAFCCHCVHYAQTIYFLGPGCFIHLQPPVRCDKTRNDVVVDNRRHNQLRDLAWSIVKQQEDPAERSRVRREDADALLTREVRRLISTRA